MVCFSLLGISQDAVATEGRKEEFDRLSVMGNDKIVLLSSFDSSDRDCDRDSGCGCGSDCNCWY